MAELSSTSYIEHLNIIVYLASIQKCTSLRHDDGLVCSHEPRGQSYLPTHLVLTPAPVNTMACLLWRTHSTARSTFFLSCSALSKNSLFSSSSWIAGLNPPLPPVPTTGRWRSTVCEGCVCTGGELQSKLLVPMNLI